MLFVLQQAASTQRSPQRSGASRPPRPEENVLPILDRGAVPEDVLPVFGAVPEDNGPGPPTTTAADEDSPTLANRLPRKRVPEVGAALDGPDDMRAGRTGRPSDADGRSFELANFLPMSPRWAFLFSE